HLATAGVARFHRVSQLRIQHTQGSHAADPRAPRVPKTGERHDDVGQGIERIGPLERRDEEGRQLAAGGEGVEQTLEQYAARAELVVHGHAGDPGAARHGVDAEGLGAGPGGEERPGRAQYPGAGALCRGLAPAEPVGAGAHETLAKTAALTVHTVYLNITPGGPMSVYAIAVFLHIVGALGLFAALALEWASLYNLRRVPTAGQAREWAKLLSALRFVGG